MTEIMHSHLPWHIDNDCGWIIRNNDGRSIAVLNARDAVNARLIVTAVNSHAELLAAAKEALDAWNDTNGMGAVYNMTRASSSLRAAIAKAEERTS